MDYSISTMTCSIFFTSKDKGEIYIPLDNIFNALNVDESLIFLSLNEQVKGKKITPNLPKTFFTNCINIIFNSSWSMNSTFNLKMSSYGSIQITGVKDERDIIDFLKYLSSKVSYFDNYGAYINCCMSNICFNLLNLENLNRDAIRAKFENYPNFITISEPISLYAGILIKNVINLEQFKQDTKILYLNMNQLDNIQYVDYEQFINFLPEKKKKKYSKVMYSTITIFLSGKVILSSKNLNCATTCMKKVIEIMSIENMKP